MDEFAKNPTLRNFAQIPEPSPVRWRKRPGTNKYYVEVVEYQNS